MTDFGHVKISRKAYLDDPLWNEVREFSKWEAWEWMIQAAAWRDHKRLVSGTMVGLSRGEFVASLRFMADAWGWSVKKVRSFLAQVSDMDRIRAQRETQAGTVYLLVNYDTYQSTPDEMSEPEGTLGAQGFDESPEKVPEKGTARGTEKPNNGAGFNDSGAQLGAQQGHSRGTPGAQSRSSKSSKAERNGYGATAQNDSRTDNGTPTDAQRLVNLVIDRGLNGVNPSDYGKQAAHAKHLLSKQPLGFWTEAAGKMSDLFPYSDGEAWDVFDLGKKATKAMATKRNGDHAADDDDGFWTDPDGYT